MSERRVAYPEIEPFRIGKLDVGDGHVLHFEECGNPDGKPVVMIHGGPGGGSNTFMRRLHDPSNYRIVLFDQRGAGKSTPAASRISKSSAGSYVAGHGARRWRWPMPRATLRR
jgi:proline iminopeptidase